MTRPYIPLLDTVELPWIVGAERHRRLTGGWVQPGPEIVHQRWFFKELTLDDESGAATLLYRHSAGLCYPAAGYHPVFEEAFFIAGTVGAFEDSPDVPSLYKRGYYFFRPPGWIHDSEIMADQDTLILRMVSGHDARVATDWSSIGRNALLPIDQAVEPRGYIRCLSTEDLAWTHAYEFLSVHGWGIDLTYVPKGKLWFKLLSKDRTTGAATVLMRMDERFIQPTAGCYTAAQELYVLEGELRIGDRVLGPGCYVYRPPGYVEGPVEASKECLLFCRFDGQVRRVERPLQDVDLQIVP